MRVAALYDIHGNLPALDAVLAEVEEARVDMIVCGGDLVSGPFPVEVFDRLAAVENVRYVRGNGDRDVLEGAERDGRAEVAERLGDARLAEIRTWPLTVKLDIDELGSVLFCHATPRSDLEIVTRITPDDEFVEPFAGVPIAVVGHTHIQFDRRVGDVRVVNAGSVGGPYEGRRGAFWALLGPDVEFRCTTYDIEAAADAIRAAGKPELAGWLLDPEDPNEISAYFEGQRGS